MTLVSEKPDIKPTKTPETYEDWLGLSKTIEIPKVPIVNGRAHSADAMRSITTPRTGKVVAEVPEFGPEDVDAAVKSAHTAFEAGPWRRMPGVERKKLLLRLADLMERDQSELALLECLDAGKSAHVAYTKDLVKCINAVRWYAEWIDKLHDEVPYTRPDAVAMVRRIPVGVVVAITAWNYPLYMAILKIAPALALGNTVVLKPSQFTPLSAIKMSQLAAEAGLPDGVFNVVTGDGPVAGKELATHPLVASIAFTGSTGTAGQIMAYAGQNRLKKVQLECGGKSPQIVLADTKDLDAAAYGIASGIFYNQGQVCNAGSRLIVEDSIKDKLLEKVIEITEAEYRPDDPLKPTTNVGPLIHQDHMDKVMGYIDIAKEEGASLLYGGSRVMEETGGCYVEPTIFDDADNSMRISREEVFGPVLSVIPVKSAQEAVTIANDSPFGLTASVWTSDVTKAHSIADAVQAGIVWVNAYNTSEITIPFGGVKQSGFGRDKSVHAFDKYCEIKTTWIELSDSDAVV